MTKVGIMQPYFFPYLGYFSLIKHTHKFILLDSVQSIRHGWLERNRVLRQDGGWLYIRVPLVKHSRATPIKDLLIDDRQPWRSKLTAQLQIYKRIAPHYRAVIDLVSGALAQDFTTLVSLNKATLEAVCSYLHIRRRLPLFSELDLDIEPPSAPDEWALNICRAMGDVSEYWNPPGGRAFMDASKYEAAGIRLRFHAVRLQEYDQRRQPFEAGLSIIDVLMFNSVEEVNTMLDSYQLG